MTLSKITLLFILTLCLVFTGCGPTSSANPKPDCLIIQYTPQGTHHWEVNYNCNVSIGEGYTRIHQDTGDTYIQGTFVIERVYDGNLAPYKAKYGIGDTKVEGSK